MFEWDENKRLANLAKHRLDFLAVPLVFDGRAFITTKSSYPIETRYITTAIVNEKFYTVVWTWRDDIKRIISFRRARNGEERAYCQIHG